MVVPSVQQGAILLFDSTGAFVRRVGRPGQGPGEYVAVVAVEPGIGDSVLVMDAGNHRLDVLTPLLGSGRSAPLALEGAEIAALADGGLLMSTGFGRRGAEPSHRLHRLDPSFRVVRSFMAEASIGRDEDPARARRRMSATRRGIVAVAHHGDYVVEIWDGSGRHLETLRREPEWFPASPPEAGRPLDREPRPRVVDVRLDEDGRIWILAHVPDPEWEEAVKPGRDPYGRPAMAIAQSDLSDYMDSVVEILDLRTNALVASVRMDPYVDFLLPGGFAASYREDEVGHPRIDVWQLTLAGP